MKRATIAGLVILLAILTPLYPAASQDREKTLALIPTKEGPLKGKQIYTNSHALLVGINEYPNLPKDRALSYAVKDVEGLKAVLVRHYGFPAENIKTLLDEQATLANIKEALSSFADKRKVQENDRVLIYFSGHGQTVKLPTGGEMGFLLPYDAKVDLDDFENAGPYLNTCLGMDTVKNYLDTTPAKHTLVMADACYSGLLRGARAIQPSAAALAALAARRSTQIMTAGRKGETSLELANLGHGAFTYKLIEELKARANTAGDVFHAHDLYSSLSVAVANVTEGKQSPTFGDLGTEGQFFFIVANPAGGSPATPPAANNNKPVKETQAKPNVESVDTIARVKVDSVPSGAKIFLNGRQVPGKVTPATIDLDLELESSREVEIGIKFDGYKTALRKATLVRGSNPALSIRLDKAAVQPPAEPAVDKSETPAAPAAAGILVRNWKTGSGMRGKTTLEVHEAEGEPSTLQIVFKAVVKNVDAAGTATLLQTTESAKKSSGLADEDVPMPAETQIVDRLGRLLNPEGADPLFKLVAVVTEPLVPGRRVAPNESWTTTIPNPGAPGQNMTLTGKLLGTEKVLGVNAWKIKQTGRVDIPTELLAVTNQIDLTFWVDPATGMPLKVQGTLTSSALGVKVMELRVLLEAMEIF